MACPYEGLVGQVTDKCGYCEGPLPEIEKVWHVRTTTGDGEILLFEGWFCSKECADRKTFLPVSEQ